MIILNKITQPNCIQWNNVQRSCTHTQIFIPVIFLFRLKKCLKKVLRKWKFGLSLGLYESALDTLIYHY